MIGTRLAASGAVRPFYNRQPVGAAETIVRTALGTAYEYESGDPIETITISSLSLAATDTLLVATMHNNLFDADAYSITIDGRYPGTDRIRATSGNFAVIVWSLPMAGTPIVGQDLVLSFAGSTDYPSILAMLAIKVAGLRQSPAPFDRAASAGATGSTQDSGYTSTVAQAHMFLWGIIGTEGSTADSLGTWDASWLAGQRAGGTFCDLKEASWIVNSAPTTYRARLTGATSRPYGAICAAYSAA